MRSEPQRRSVAELVQELSGRASGARFLLGICGSPGSGKSTLAAQLAAAVGCPVVGMDGFHLAQAELVRLGRAGRKGAPDTFDAAGYVALLERLRRDDEPVVYAPEFRREIEDAVSGVVPVERAEPLVLTEGNYLLLDEPPWDRVRHVLDEIWFLHLDDTERQRRLTERHRHYGRTAAEARDRTCGSDQRNAELIDVTRMRASRVIELTP